MYKINGTFFYYYYSQMPLKDLRYDCIKVHVIYKTENIVLA